MPAIVIEELRDFVKEWLPKDANCLSDAQIELIGTNVISEVCVDVPVDDQDPECYPEVKCKTLRDCAIANRALAVTGGGGLKREKTYMEEVEYYQGNGDNLWDDYIDGLVVMCPLFGYNGLASKGAGNIKINVPDPVNVPCGSVPYGRTGFDGCCGSPTCACAIGGNCDCS